MTIAADATRGTATAGTATGSSLDPSILARPFTVGGGSAGAADLDLVRSVRGGDEEAFAALFRRHGPVAYTLALRLLRQQFMAEEVVQEVFLALWRKPDGFREDRGSVRSWLLSAVHHKAVDAVRREEAERRRNEEAIPDIDIEEDVADVVAQRATTRDARVAIRSVLRLIPAEQREVLVLMYLCGKTQAQIASELALPLGTVKSRCLLGMRRLRHLLAEVRG